MCWGSQLLITAMMAQGLRNGSLRQQSPHRPADRSSPAAQPYFLLGTPLTDDLGPRHPSNLFSLFNFPSYLNKRHITRNYGQHSSN